MDCKLHCMVSKVLLPRYVIRWQKKWEFLLNFKWLIEIQILELKSFAFYGKKFPYSKMFDLSTNVYLILKLIFQTVKF